MGAKAATEVGNTRFSRGLQRENLGSKTGTRLADVQNKQTKAQRI